MVVVVVGLMQGVAAGAGRVEEVRKVAGVGVGVVREGESVAGVAFEGVGDSDAERVGRVVGVVGEEVGKYAEGFLRGTGLKGVWVGRGVRVEGQARAGVVLLDRGVVVVDVGTPVGRGYLRHVIHHEYWHLIEGRVAGDFYFLDPVWEGMNPFGFKYGGGGRWEQDSARDPGKLDHPQAGFVDRYAMSGEEEDRAEVFACLGVAEEGRVVEGWGMGDGVLEGKVKYMREFVGWWGEEGNKRVAEFLGAVGRDDVGVVERMLGEDGGLARRVGWEGWRPMQWAAVHGARGVMGVLVRYGVGVDEVDERGWTALHVAAMVGRVEVAHWLVDRGADVGVRDEGGRTAGEWARVRGFGGLGRVLESGKFEGRNSKDESNSKSQIRNFKREGGGGEKNAKGAR